MKRFILAIQFLTLLPIKKGVEVTKTDLAGSMAYFPAVGALQGVILVIVDYALKGVLPDSVINALLLIVLVITNGGLHLDGFADTVDGLAGGSSAPERLRIMRDSSIGAIGVVFVVLILLLKYAAIGGLPAPVRARSIFLFPVMGRWSMVPMAYWGRYARQDFGLGSAFAGNSFTTLFAATACCAFLVFLMFGVFSLTVVFILGVFAWLLTAFFSKRLGGVTGDVFGFQSEAAETLFLITVLVLMKVSPSLLGSFILK